LVYTIKENAALGWVDFETSRLGELVKGIHHNCYKIQLMILQDIISLFISLTSKDFIYRNSVFRTCCFLKIQLGEENMLNIFFKIRLREKNSSCVSNKFSIIWLGGVSI
jgi:hypothetical protein